MTAYTNFIEDFAGRCMEVLQKAEKSALLSDRDVTLSLMASSAGILIPFERLKPEGKWSHPSGDKKNFPEHANRLKELMDESFLGSKLHPEKESKWLSGSLNSLIANPDNWGNPDSWPELNKKNVMKKEKTVYVVKRMWNKVGN